MQTKSTPKNDPPEIRFGRKTGNFPYKTQTYNSFACKQFIFDHIQDKTAFSPYKTQAYNSFAHKQFVCDHYPDKMRPDQCIFFLLTRTAQDGTSRLAKALEPYKITPAQAIVLAFLSEEEDFRIFNELAFEMRIDSATMSGIVNRLKSARLVVRVRNPLDRRSVMIRLTKKGKEVAQKIKTVISNSDRSFLSRMDKTDRENLRSILIRMYNTR